MYIPLTNMNTNPFQTNATLKLNVFSAGLVKISENVFQFIQPTSVRFDV